jgi:hypothetical protein
VRSVWGFTLVFREEGGHGGVRRKALYQPPFPSLVNGKNSFNFLMSFSCEANSCFSAKSLVA